MTIHASDIKLRASKVMADVPEGGGGPSATEIAFGQSNTIFDDIDSISRTLGNVSIRQLHMHVDTPTVDKLLGAYGIVSKLPNDSNVSIVLATCAPFAKRSEIADAIANYLIRGVPWGGFLLGNHVAGQANMQIFQRPGDRVPTIGRTLVLIVNEGQSNEQVEWVRVIKVESEVRTFSYSNGGQIVDYQAQVVTCDLASPLSQPLPGTDPNPLFQADAGKTKIRDTAVADAANYYGASALGTAATLGATSIKVESAYGQVVPSSSTPVPSLDQLPAGQRVITLATAPRSVQVGATPHSRRIKIGQENRGLSYIGQMQPIPEPGTCVWTWVALGNRYTITDDGAGNLSGSGVGTINYTTGSWSITLPQNPDVGSAIVSQWGERIAYTNRSSQGAQVRAPEYAFQLEHEGYVAGTLAITWTSGGATKTASANAAGTISGDAAGSVDNASGSVYLRPSAMPDAGGQFAITYDTSTLTTETLTPGAPDAGGYIALNLANTPAAGTVQVQWVTAQKVSSTSGGSVSSKTAQNVTDSRTVYVLPPGTPSNQRFPANYVAAQVQPSATGGSSYSTQTDTTNDQTNVVTHTASDDGTGTLAGGRGTVNYSGESISLRVITAGRSTTSYKSDSEDAAAFNDQTINGSGTSNSASNSKGGDYSTTTIGEEVLAASSVTVKYRVGAAVNTPQTMSWETAGVALDLCPYTSDRVVPNSVQFLWMGQTYIDIDGSIYRTSGGGNVKSGLINYTAGVAFMTDYVVGGTGPADFTLQSLWTSKGDWKTASLFMMTSAAPVQPTQYTLFILDVAGTALTAVGDLNGNLTGSHVLGKIEYQSGLVELQFGDFVDDATLTDAQKAEWWYSAADVGAVQEGKIWRPWPVDPASLRYNIVSNLFLPVDPVILGLNPTRLPQDGKVPIYKKGRVLIIGNNQTIAPATYAAGNVVDCGRTRLSHVWIIDKNGALITDGWHAEETDLDAGQVYIDDVAGWAQPVTVEHRVQDMALCTDVQIDGTLGLNLPLSHDYPVGSVVSSAVLFGDTFARVMRQFDQQSWDGVSWADAPVSNVATASYNDTAYPITVTNAGALSDRFALRIRSDATNYDLNSEHMGQIGAGSINADFAPNSPIKPGTPLFSLKSAGWGSGWVAGNTLFLGVQAAMQSIAVIRAVQPGAPSGIDYSFDLLTGGDIDRPPSAP